MVIGMWVLTAVELVTGGWGLRSKRCGRGARGGMCAAERVGVGGRVRAGGGGPSRAKAASKGCAGAARVLALTFLTALTQGAVC